MKIKITELTYPSKLNVVKRSSWGWKVLEEAKNEHKIDKVTIHHGGVYFNPEKNVIEYLRNLQDWSRTEKKWIDIPYHFIVDMEGNIYEARPINYPGDTNTDYDVNGHALINVIGNYEVQIINEKQIEALVGLSSFVCNKYSVSVDNILSHKDYTETLCPGKNLYKHLPEIRNKVKTILNY